MLIRAGIVAAVIAGATLLLWQGGGSLRSSPPEPLAGAERLPPPASALDGLPESAVGRRAVAPAAAAPPAQTPPALPAPEIGALRGILVDGEALPMPHQVVLLRRGTGIAEQRLSVRTDADGMFEFAEVPAGSWRAGVLITPERGQASATALQTLEVFAEQRSWVDLWLIGARAVRGRILIEEDGLPSGMVFEVEARPCADPERVVSDTIAASDASEHFEPVPAQAELERRVVQEFLEENPGAPLPDQETITAWAQDLAEDLGEARLADGAVFSLGGLHAEPHVVRIYLDVARERWAEVEVDLREGDVELGLLRLRFEDFPRRTAD